jgi:ankyrin repeat protein
MSQGVPVAGAGSRSLPRQLRPNARVVANQPDQAGSPCLVLALSEDFRPATATATAPSGARGWPASGVDLLLRAGARVGSCDRGGVCALQWGVQRAEAAAVRLLLDAGAACPPGCAHAP